jgi:uncharacterized lipoprotein NlpE involved in copper resistance
VPLDDGRFLVGAYEGRLPCDGCAGIRTRLTLHTTDGRRAASGTYAMTETRLGRREGAQRIRSSGRWARERGALGTLYVLTPEAGGTTRSFLLTDHGSLEELDAAQARRPDAPTLVREDTPPPTP